MPPPSDPSLDEIRTLVDLVRFRKKTCGDREFAEVAGESITFAQLADEMDRYALAFRDHGVERGDRVVLVLPTSKEFLFAFFGIERVGAIPVPVYPNSPPGRISRIVEDSRASTIFAEDRFFEAAGAAVKQWRTMRPRDVGEPDGGKAHSLPVVEAGDIAFLQYTSGSTAEPKGVVLSHSNLLVNMRAIIERMQHHEREVGVSWLPLYHDMGLIGFVFCPLLSASRVVLLPAGLRNPINWLQTLSDQRAHFTGAPDVAYRLAAESVDTTSLHLDNLRVAYSGAEPVRGATVRAFHDRFGLTDVIVPCYGLAESALCVTTIYPGTPIREDERGFVCVGRPISGTEIEIVRGSEKLPPTEVGEITIRAASNTSGYWGNGDEQEDLFTERGFLRSGDLGYLDVEGRLYVVGRSKNIIIRGGENIAPQELESAADPVPGVRFSAAIGVELEEYGSGEQILLFVEIPKPLEDPAGYARLVRSIQEAIRDRLGFVPNKIYCVTARSIPRTVNGKIRHAVLRDMYLEGRLQAEGRILFPR